MNKFAFLLAVGYVLNGAAHLVAQHPNCNAPQQCYGPPPNCYQPQSGCYMPPAGCYCPPTNPNGPQADRPEETGAFVTPPPTGETVGAANSLGLRMGSVRIPEINIPFPTLKLPHIVHYRRNQEVELDRAVAAFQRNAEIVNFGQLADRPGPQPDRTEPKKTAPPRPQCCPPMPPPPCCPPPEGCATFMGSPAQAWQNSQQYELAKKQEQVDQLKSQVTELKEMVDQLARRKLQSAPADQSIKPVRFQRQRIEVGEYCAPLQQSISSSTMDEKLSRLEQQIKALTAAQTAMGENARTTSAMAEQEADSSHQPASKSGLFSRLKGYLTRG